MRFPSPSTRNCFTVCYCDRATHLPPLFPLDDPTNTQGRDLGIKTSQLFQLDATTGVRTNMGTTTMFRTVDGMIHVTAQLNCPYLIWSSSLSATDTNNFL